MVLLAGCPAQQEAAKTGADPTPAKTAAAKTADGAKTVVSAKTSPAKTAPAKTVAEEKTEDKTTAPRPPVKMQPVDNRPLPRPTKGIDLSKRVKAPARIALPATVQVGLFARQVAQGQGYRAVSHYAVVGERGDAWLIEHVPYGLAAWSRLSPEADRVVMGLVVAKQDGRVRQAVLGRKGEGGRPIRIFARRPAPAAPKQEDVTLTLSFGEVRAKLITSEIHKQGNVRTWMGTGDLSGVLLKMQALKQTKTLKAKPKAEAITVGGEQVRVRKCFYDNGDEVWHSDHPAIKAFYGGTARSKSGSSTTRITAVSTKATPQLKWP